LTPRAARDQEGAGETRALIKREQRKESARCELRTFADELSLSGEIEGDAERICDAVLDKRIAVGRPLRVVEASSLYAACRVRHSPVTIRELALVSGTNGKEIGSCYKSILDRMNMAPPSLNGTGYTLKIAARVAASREATDLSIDVEGMAVDGGLGDRNPMTLAAAAVYTACLIRGEPKTQADLADAAGVSEASVRDCARAIRQLMSARREKAVEAEIPIRPNRER